MNEYLKVIRHNYANFSGRARRREYWMFVLINAVISIVLQLPFQIQNMASLSGDAATPSGIGLISLILTAVYALAVFVPSLAVTVRRLHDTGKSGWWYLIALVPLIGGLVLLVFTVLDSEPGSNRWGPSPKPQEGVAPAASW